MTDTLVERDMLLHNLEAVAEERARKATDKTLAPSDFLEGQAAATLKAQASRIAELEGRVKAVRDCIERGYPTIGKTDKCQHDCFGFEDCVACYDEALLKALGDTLLDGGGGE
jgi:hypothetical protein